MKEPKDDEDWFCSPGCMKEREEHAATILVNKPVEPGEDYLRNYAVAIVWNGLLDMAHRDAVREADGPAMMTMWRCNMVRFWLGNHNNYLIVGHRLLAG
jgi:hypothetical protein